MYKFDVNQSRLKLDWSNNQKNVNMWKGFDIYKWSYLVCIENAHLLHIDLFVKDLLHTNTERTL